MTFKWKGMQISFLFTGREWKKFFTRMKCGLVPAHLGCRNGKSGVYPLTSSEALIEITEITPSIGYIMHHSHGIVWLGDTTAHILVSHLVLYPAAYLHSAKVE